MIGAKLVRVMVYLLINIQMKLSLRIDSTNDEHLLSCGWMHRSTLTRKQRWSNWSPVCQWDGILLLACQKKQRIGAPEVRRRARLWWGGGWRCRAQKYYRINKIFSRGLRDIIYLKREYSVFSTKIAQFLFKKNWKTHIYRRSRNEKWSLSVPFMRNESKKMLSKLAQIRSNPNIQDHNETRLEQIGKAELKWSNWTLTFI